jgi:hypothetical protein
VTEPETALNEEVAKQLGEFITHRCENWNCHNGWNYRLPENIGVCTNGYLPTCFNWTFYLASDEMCGELKVTSKELVVIVLKQKPAGSEKYHGKYLSVEQRPTTRFERGASQMNIRSATAGMSQGCELAVVITMLCSDFRTLRYQYLTTIMSRNNTLQEEM